MRLAVVEGLLRVLELSRVVTAVGVVLEGNKVGGAKRGSHDGLRVQLLVLQDHLDDEVDSFLMVHDEGVNFLLDHRDRALVLALTSISGVVGRRHDILLLGLTVLALTSVEPDLAGLVGVFLPLALGPFLGLLGVPVAVVGESLGVVSESLGLAPGVVLAVALPLIDVRLLHLLGFLLPLVEVGLLHLLSFLLPFGPLHS